MFILHIHTTLEYVVSSDHVAHHLRHQGTAQREKRGVA